MIPWLSPTHLDFPPVDDALQEPNGLLAAGGDLSAQRLVNAYRHAIFPWFSEDEPILWWSLTLVAYLSQATFIFLKA